MKRRSNRLKEYNYTNAGAYFVTVCTEGKKLLFGEIVNTEMKLNDFGKIVADCWNEIPKHFPNVELDVFVLMPNHLHRILMILDDMSRGKACLAPTKNRFGKPIPNSLSVIVGSYKSAVTKRVRESLNLQGLIIWQRNYYEHIVRNEEALNRIREYISSNPLGWELDHENPERKGKDEFYEWISSFQARGIAGYAPTKERLVSP